MYVVLAYKKVSVSKLLWKSSASDRIQAIAVKSLEPMRNDGWLAISRRDRLPLKSAALLVGAGSRQRHVHRPGGVPRRRVIAGIATRWPVPDQASCVHGHSHLFRMVRFLGLEAHGLEPCYLANFVRKETN
jgi:hypothetical protein